MNNAVANKLVSAIEAERERFAVPGCAVGVVMGGRVVLSRGFGRRDVARSLPVTTETLFPIGSSTKTFTAALCSQVVDEGYIGWDTPIVDHLPGFRLKDPVATLQLSLRDMLAHRSGLPRHDLLWYASSDGTFSREDLIARLRHLEASRGFRQAWQYNNMLYTTAGELAGRLVGMSYEDAVRQRILLPLGMERTNFSVAETSADQDSARPYTVPQDGPEPLEIPFANLDLIGPAGNINSCVTDLLPWLLQLLGQGNGPQRVLSPAGLEAMRAPVIPIGDLSPMQIGDSVGYALGLAVDDYRGHRVHHHGGNIDGFSSQVSFVAEAGVGIVVLANRDNTTLRDALPFVLYDILLGLDQRAHGATMLAKEQALRMGAVHVRESRSGSDPDRPAVRSLEDYAGGYHHAGYGTVDVTLVDGRLLVTYRAVSGTLEHRYLEVFDLVAKLAGNEVRIPAQFHHDLSGDVSALTSLLDPQVAPIRFDRMPDREGLTDEFLESATGTYAMGPIEVVVARRGRTGIVVSIAGGAPREVTARGQSRFSVDGLTVEFVPPHTLRTPLGDFVKVEP